jgi:hypothetical protein
LNSVSTGQSSSKDIIVSFITYNGYGNNLYIDNLLVGHKPEFDVAVVSVMNIYRDTTFVTDTNDMRITPQTMIYNAGKNPVSNPFLIFMTINEFGYNEHDTVSSLNTSGSLIIEFDTLTAITDIPFTLKVFIQYLDSAGADSNSANDTLIQKGIFLTGEPKKILIEEFTNSNSPGCASQDPFLNSFINNNYGDICAVKYHTGFPLPANDSMYLFNPEGSDARRNYYFVNSVPNTLMNGINPLPLPYSRDSILNANFNFVRRFASPVSVTVRDSAIGSDSVQSIINVKVLYNLKPGEYRLRVMSVERLVTYAEPPGSNGQTEFFDVFRRFYPDSNGFEVSNSAGNYEFSVTYPLENAFTDTMIYTVAFVQNDVTREILNCGRGRDIIINISPNALTGNDIIKQDLDVTNLGWKYLYNRSRFVTANSVKDSLYTGNNFFELFEYEFPPQGWTLFNTDRSYSIMQESGVNGISMGGLKSLKMPFFDYSNIGQRDTLMTNFIYNINETDTLQFDYAYARYIGNFIDSLKVEISTDGGSTFTEIFNKGGTVLATVPSTTLPFAPKFISEWRTFRYPMSLLLGSDSYFAGKPAFELMQNFPNPFNPRTVISYRVFRDGFIVLKIYDITGREMKTLVSGFKRKGDYYIEFESASLSSGVYFYSMISGDYSDTKKMVLLK